MGFVFLYQMGIWVLKFVLGIGSLFNAKMKRGVKGRKGLLRNLENSFADLSQGRPVAWFHAASLGEFEQGRPVIELFRVAYPQHFIVLTFFSPSGYDVRSNYQGADYICYLPLDTQSNASKFVSIINPEIVFFIKYEFWFNYLRALREKGAIVISFSTIFRPDQVFFKFYGGFYRKLLGYFSHILVQNQQSLDLLGQIGIKSCSIAGDTRFDRVRSIAASVRQLPEIISFTENSYCLVAGSVWQADMDVLIPALNALTTPIKAIFAPHEIRKEQMEKWSRELAGECILYSEYIRHKQNTAFQYLIIDNVGMLSSLYRYGNSAYIGGAFGSGLHNILEAATFNLPIIFGDQKYDKFQEAIDLVAQGGAQTVSNAAELSLILNALSTDPQLNERMGAISQAYVISHTGATASVMNEVRRLLRR